ncbi:MAG: protein translocase subunit SecD [Ignavibacteriaceae bacterium]|nr:protein translocase subunit SecD [Ignavibacteriaceae bacterium]
MKEIRLRLFIIIAAVVFSIYLLYPTYVDYQKTKNLNKLLDTKKQELLHDNANITPDQLDKKLKQSEDSIKAADPSYVKARSQRIKLGLDLQGGMRVVLEVNTSKLISKVAKNPDDVFKKVIAESDKESALSDESVVDIFARKLSARGIRLSRYFGSVRDDDNKIKSDLKKDAEDAVSRAMEIIRNRVDQYGVSEPSIQRQGTRRIIVELPGVAREEEAKQLLQGTALLEFRLLKDPELTFSVMQKVDNVLAGKSLIDTTKSDSIAAADTSKSKTNLAKTDTSAEQKQKDIEKNHPFFAIAHLLDPQGRSADAAVRADEREKLTRLLNRPDVQNAIPNNVEFIYSAKSFKNTNDNKDYYTLYLVNKEPELTGGVITNARANIDPTTSSAVVDMEMNSDGASEWSRITGANIHKRIAIILDGVAFSAPVVQGKIPSGRSQISGMANMEEAKLLEIILKAGALPAPVDIIEERTIGPSLGQDSVTNGLTSMTIGYVLVGLFMIFYYRRAGDIAAATLTLIVLFILGILAGFGATLTLPGMAGIVLTMGMAVDANVLIYERIREELGTGKTIKASVEGGFSKAMPAILDSNITTFFTGIILYQFGTGPVQGFALTLMIGIITSLFGALVISRVIFDWMVAKGAKINIG